MDIALVAERESHKHPPRLTLSTPDCPRTQTPSGSVGQENTSLGSCQYLWLTPTLSANCQELCSASWSYLLCASEKSVEGTADTRRLNEPQMPSVCTVVLVPGSEKMERDSGHLLAAGTSSTCGHGHGHAVIIAVQGHTCFFK